MSNMTRRVLMVAYHFPPVSGGSGVQRALRFAQYLPDHGWQPIVLAPHPRAYPRCAPDLLAKIAPDVVVRRSFALDAARHLAVGGRYPRMLALPDRWSSWWLGAVPAGLQLIRRFKPAAIWSTYPVATAHLIGATLERLTGLPWIADVRDPLVQGGYPRSRAVRCSYAWLERRIARRASKAVFVTPGLAAYYRSRFPELSAERSCVIENGFDEETFARIEYAHPSPAPEDDHFTLLHSGLMYPSARDPLPLFLAMRQLSLRGVLDEVGFKLVFRAAGSGDRVMDLARATGVSRWVAIAPSLDYADALEEMRCAHALLLLQGAICNDQIPAKLYEYLRARRPIFALTDRSGDSAGLLARLKCDAIVCSSAPDFIAEVLEAFIARVRTGAASISAAEDVARYSRRALTQRLAEVLDEAAAEER